MEIPVMTKMPKEWLTLPPILSVQEIADLLSVHPNTVKNWIADGKLPAFKAGRVIRVYRDDFFEFTKIDTEED